jgi:predicted  nucleic acid-binding Zn-ribbon protein
MNDHIPDATKMISDTPRTDAEAFLPHDSKYRVCDADFARQLERELNAANDRIKRLEEDLMDAKNQYAVLVADVVLYEDRGERIKRLEEAGDALYENSNPSRWDSPESAAQKMVDQLNWTAAKEANP